MKKIILLLSVFAFTLGMNAQTVLPNKALGKEQVVYEKKSNLNNLTFDRMMYEAAVELSAR
jgi:hypothetical protein